MAEWDTGEVLAWTRRDGVTPPPRGANTWLLGFGGLMLTGLWVTVVATDDVCAAHRVWVEAFAMFATIVTVVAVVGMVGQRFWAPFAAMASALCGVGVGLADSVEDAARGVLLAVGFAGVFGLVLVAAVPQVRAVIWVHRATTELDSPPLDPLGDPRDAASTKPDKGAALADSDRDRLAEPADRGSTEGDKVSGPAR